MSQQRIGAGGVHDVGGCCSSTTAAAAAENAFAMKLDLTEQPISYWEQSIHALLVVLACKSPPLITTDELRRAVEALEPAAYNSWSYYDKWSAAIATVLLERGIIQQSQLHEEIYGDETEQIVNNSSTSGDINSNSNNNTSATTSATTTTATTAAGNAGPRFEVGQQVIVKSEDSRLRWRRPHIRCPGYLFGQRGTVLECVGTFLDPFLLAFRIIEYCNNTQQQQKKQRLYRVQFSMRALWATTGCKASAAIVSTSTSTNNNANSNAGVAANNATASDTFASSNAAVDDLSNESDGFVVVDIYEDWLSPCSSNSSSEDSRNNSSCEPNPKRQRINNNSLVIIDKGDPISQISTNSSNTAEVQEATIPAEVLVDSTHHNNSSSTNNNYQQQHHSHIHDHSHDHSHHHSHEERYVVECAAAEKEGPVRPGKVVGDALLRLLQRSSVVTAAQLHGTITALETAHTRMMAKDLVVRAWKDATFKERLLQNASAAAAELNINTSNPNAPTVLKVVANTPQLHNIIVCTLCSCYPQSLLGFSPSWYKSKSYRARAVRQPRELLAEFGTVLANNMRIQVHDSTADCRYLVLPLPPKHVDVKLLSDEQLRQLITRDSMIGVTVL